MAQTGGTGSRRFRIEREFGFIVGGILAALGGLSLVRRGPLGWNVALLAVGAVLVVLGAVAPRLLVVPNRLWMKLAELLGRIVSPIVLGIVYFLVITPIGVVRRLTGADPLQRRGGRRPSYWLPYSARQRDPRHYEKMY
jgi:hypothetical protein